MNLSVSAALVIAHPGHELLVYGWLQATQPRVYVLTDGSGSTGEARLTPCSKVLEDTGATPGTIFGRFPDRDVYAALQAHNHTFFCDLVDELCDEFKQHEITCVVGDAVEGYSTSHDVCRLMIDAAVEKNRLQSNRLQSNRGLENYDFMLVQSPTECGSQRRERAIPTTLDDATLNKKYAAAREYYADHAGLVDETLQKLGGLEGLRTEVLHSVVNRFAAPLLDDDFDGFETQKPYYEIYGEQQVAAGHYQQVIRYREHIAPLARTLRRFVRQNIKP